MFQVSNQLVNRLMAIGAVIISVASLYVAVLQTRASQQQVKAETWPYLQIDSGNYDLQTNEWMIYYSVVNAGVGPARLENMQLLYDGEPVDGFFDFARRCCEQDVPIPWGPEILESGLIGTVVTANPSSLILPSESRIPLFRLTQEEGNRVFWDSINKARNELEARACFCSVLDECWETNFVDEPQLVKQCRLDPELDYRG